MFDIPILIIAYKRTDSLLVLLKTLDNIQPEKIYIAVDAAPTDNIDDFQKNNKVKRIIEEYPFKSKVFTNFQQINLGCGEGPKKAIDWFFKSEEKGIILEDDCLPDISFFSFCKEMLCRYEFEDRIMSISGDNYLFDSVEITDSYYFTKYPNIWGWATWKRAWLKMDWEMTAYLDFLKSNKLSNYANTQEEFWYWKKTFDDVYNHHPEYWDYQWLYSIWNNNGFGIAPAVNLVINVGFDNESTHTTNMPKWYDKIKLNKIETIKHPSEIKINQKADDYLFNNIIQTPKANTIWSKIRRRLSTVKNKIIPRTLLWKDNEYFDPIWKERIKKMSAYLGKEDKVVDLGCGMMWLKEYLDSSNVYVPVDYKKRDNQTLVCDFNKAEFPNEDADIYFVSGCMEYVEDYKWFVEKISEHTKRCVISYCTLDKYDDYNLRKSLMWKNHLKEEDVIKLFSDFGFSMKDINITDLNNHVFYFVK